MESPLIPSIRQHRALHALLGVTLGMLCLPAAAEPLKLYRYLERGMPVYSSHPPENIAYTVVYPGGGAARSEPDVAVPAGAVMPSVPAATPEGEQAPAASTASAPLKLYLYRDKGMPVYSSHPPQNLAYTVVRPGSGAPRPVLSLPPPPDTSPPPLSSVVAGAGVEESGVLIGWAASCKGVTPAMLDQRAAQWQHLAAKHAKAHGVPYALVRAIMRVESCFDARAVSRVGARGLMQLMPATAAELGVIDSFDADQNIAGGVRYLRQLLQRFKHNTRHAIAAYNAGPTAVDAYRGVPPFPETKSYVERVIAEYRAHGERKAKKPAG